eukprot:g18477.t1
MASILVLSLFPLTQPLRIAQKAQEQFDLGGGDQTPKRPPISIPSGLELVTILDDASDKIMCDMHKNMDYYYVTCRVPKPRKEAQVNTKAMMLRRRRIAKAKAIVGQLLGEAHGFTDAEAEEFTGLQNMNTIFRYMKYQEKVPENTTKTYNYDYHCLETAAISRIRVFFMFV